MEKSKISLTQYLWKKAIYYFSNFVMPYLSYVSMSLAGVFIRMHYTQFLTRVWEDVIITVTPKLLILSIQTFVYRLSVHDCLINLNDAIPV